MKPPRPWTVFLLSVEVEVRFGANLVARAMASPPQPSSAQRSSGHFGTMSGPLQRSSCCATGALLRGIKVKTLQRDLESKMSTYGEPKGRLWRFCSMAACSEVLRLGWVTSGSSISRMPWKPSRPPSASCKRAQLSRTRCTSVLRPCNGASVEPCTPRKSNRKGVDLEPGFPD